MDFKENSSGFRSGIPQGSFGVRSASSTSSIPTAQRSTPSVIATKQKVSTRRANKAEVQEESSAAREFQEFIYYQNRIGQRVAIKNAKEGTLRYVGRVHLKEGLYCGIELDEPQGLHDGHLEGRRYFECPPKCGVFAPTDCVTFVSRVEFPGEATLTGSLKVEKQMGRRQTKSAPMNRSNSTRGPKSVPKPISIPRARTDDRLNLNATYNMPSAGFDDFYDMSQSYAGGEASMTRSDTVTSALPGGNQRCNSVDFITSGGDMALDRTFKKENEGHPYSRGSESDNDDDLLLISSIDLDGITPPENFLQSSLMAESFAGADQLGMSVCSNLSDSLMFLKGSDLVDSNKESRRNQIKNVESPEELVTPVADSTKGFGQRSRADSYENLKNVNEQEQLGLSAEFDALEAEFLKTEPNLLEMPSKLNTTTAKAAVQESEYDKTMKAEVDLRNSSVDVSDVKINLRKSDKVEGRPVSLISTDTGYGDTDPETLSGGTRSNNISPSDDMLDAYETCSSQSQISTPKANGPPHSPRLNEAERVDGNGKLPPDGEFDTVVCEIVMRDGSGNIIRILKEERKIPKQFLTDPQMTINPASLATSTSAPCNSTPAHPTLTGNESEATQESMSTTTAANIDENAGIVTGRIRERHNTITLSDEKDVVVAEIQDTTPVADVVNVLPESQMKIICEVSPSKSATKPPRSSKIGAKTTVRSNSVVATKTSGPSSLTTKASSVEPEVKKQPRPVKKSRFDDVMSKINASIAQEKIKPKKVEVKSKVFSEAKPTKIPTQPTTPTGECEVRWNSSEKTSISVASTSDSPNITSSPASTVVTPKKSGLTLKLSETMPTTSTIRALPKTGIAVKHARPVGAKENKVPTDQVGHIEPKKLATSHVNGLRSVSGRQLNQSHTGKDSLPSLTSRSATSTVGKTSSSQYSTVSSRSISAAKSHEPTAPTEVSPSPSLKETISKLEQQLVERNKEIGHGKVSLKHATTGFQAMVVLVQYLTEELDAFSMPMMLETAKRVEKELNDIKSHYDGALVECGALKAQISELIEAHKAEIQRLMEENKAKVEGLTKSLNEGFEDSKQWLAQEHQKEIDQIKEEEIQQSQKLQAEFSAKLAQTVEEHTKQIELLKKKGRKQSEEVQRNSDKKMTDMEANHKSLIANLNTRIAELEKQRDHYKEEVGSLQATLMKDSDARVQMAVAKFKNLPQEIDSLKVVVEMRSQEIHQLRSQNLEYQRQLEEVPALKEKMRTLEAKHENLKEVLNIKIQAEKNLSHEYRQLLESYEREARQNKRLSMQKEELQWKLQESLMSQSFPGEQSLQHGYPRLNSETESDSDVSGSHHNQQTQSCFASLPSPSPLKAYSALGSPSPRRGDVPVQIFTSAGGLCDAEISASAAKSGVVLRAKSADTNLRRKLMTESTPGDYLNSSSVAHTSGTMLPSTNVNTGASKNPRAKSVDKSASPSKRRPPPLRGFGLSPSPKTSGNGMSISFTGELLPDVPENQSDSAMGSDEGSRPIQQRSAGHQNVSSRSKCGGPTTHLQRQTYNTSATQSASGGSGNITDSGIFTSYVSETDSDNLMVASVTSVGGESIEAEGHDGDTELSDSDAMAGPLTEVLLSGVASQPAVNSRNVVPLAVVNGKTRFIPQPSKRESPSSCSSSDKEMTPPYKPPMEQ